MENERSVQFKFQRTNPDWILTSFNDTDAEFKSSALEFKKYNKTSNDITLKGLTQCILEDVKYNRYHRFYIIVENDDYSYIDDAEIDIPFEALKAYGVKDPSNWKQDNFNNAYQIISKISKVKKGLPDLSLIISSENWIRKWLNPPCSYEEMINGQGWSKLLYKDWIDNYWAFKNKQIRIADGIYPTPDHFQEKASNMVKNLLDVEYIWDGMAYDGSMARKCLPELKVFTSDKNKNSNIDNVFDYFKLQHPPYKELVKYPSKSCLFSNPTFERIGKSNGVKLFIEKWEQWPIRYLAMFASSPLMPIKRMPCIGGFWTEKPDWPGVYKPGGYQFGIPFFIFDKKAPLVDNFDLQGHKFEFVPSENALDSKRRCDHHDYSYGVFIKEEFNKLREEGKVIFEKGCFPKLDETGSQPKLKRNKHWFNNGIEEKQFESRPEGWNKGRINFLKKRTG